MRLKTSICIMSLIIILFGLLGWRLYYLQICSAQINRERSFNQKHSTVPIQPRRGDIYSVQGRILAGSSKFYTVFAEPRQFKNPEDVKETAMTLQEILNIPGNEICGIIYESKNPGYVRIKREITLDQRDEIISKKIPGIGIQTEWRRTYPMGRLTSHIIGYVGYNQTGLAGLEWKYDSVLKGTEGKDVFVVDVRRQPINIDLEKSNNAEDGFRLILTIDTTIQQIAREALVKQIRSFEAESGIAIVMNPWTGEIYALTSWPDFEPEDYSRNISDPREPLKNRALTDPYEPGSIFKPIVTAIGLDCKAIGFNDVIFCENGYYAEYKIGEFLNHPYGNLSIKDIIAKSSNVGMAKIGLRMGKQKLYDGVKMFGFGKPTGIDLPGEDAGVVWNPKVWDKLTITRIPYGHALTVTAIQIIRAYCILANGGRPVKPYLIKSIIDPQGQVREFHQNPKMIAQMIDPEVARWMVQTAMVEVVNNGTGENAQLPDMQTFGKTGTANIARPKEQGGGYDKQNYIASFVGGAPAEDPELVVLVSIRKPNRSLKKGYSGGRVAAPVFREIMDKTMSYMHPGRAEKLARISEDN